MASHFFVPFICCFSVGIGNSEVGGRSRGAEGFDVEWIKYEEEVEESADRWSKPHVAIQPLMSVFEVRSCLAKAVMLLDLEVMSLELVAASLTPLGTPTGSDVQSFMGTPLTDGECAVHHACPAAQPCPFGFYPANRDVKEVSRVHTTGLGAVAEGRRHPRPFC
ncbi:Electrogenic sodium bicarbonate cotransporter [Echinococcus granulosus]|uniref:Electrogenic sodium bicarbonate cotransporter n=1 Tax=Echinococcus granulosus TaxID=6210 RepID=W6UG32_ECHGR|nr:Electrogenic sodium bicarbonate cotransporter [Echinococcus granulosus]EUB57082.1 Electrogenic sodium bicarbonate cotransporter [Echinococcus granulosus]